VLRWAWGSRKKPAPRFWAAARWTTTQNIRAKGEHGIRDCATHAKKVRAIRREGTPAQVLSPLGPLRAQFFFAANPISAPQILIEERHETEISEQYE
jgi:hypothetical protein